VLKIVETYLSEESLYKIFKHTSNISKNLDFNLDSIWILGSFIYVSIFLKTRNHYWSIMKITAVKKGITLIMLTLVMLLGSVTQGLTASAETLVTKGGNHQYDTFNIIPNIDYAWRIDNPSPDKNLEGSVNFGIDDIPFTVGPNGSGSFENRSGDHDRGRIYTNIQAIFNWNINEKPEKVIQVEPYKWTRFEIKQNTVYSWKLKNYHPTKKLYAYVSFLNPEPVTLGGNSSISRTNLAISSTGYVYVSDNAEFTLFAPASSK